MATHLVSTVLFLVTCIIGVADPGAVDLTHGIVVSQPFGSFQLNGFVFSYDGESIPHEMGHREQQREMGDYRYYATVAIPSVVVNVAWGVLAVGFDVWMFRPDEYNDIFPWEADANIRVMEYNR
jgi:hypothetical protein